jgi:aspartate aminotransferase-like enzyme
MSHGADVVSMRATTEVRPYRLRLPGPTAVPDRVRDALAAPIVNHRGPEFRAMFARAEELAQPIFGTKSPILFLACSGTGGMEASLVNVLAPGESVLVAVNGQFSERFAAIATALGAQVDTIEVRWGSAVDPAEIEKRVGAKDYRAVVVVHNESSTGVTTPLAPIGALLRDKPALLLADSVSGLGGAEMQQDAWAVDIVATASQKALMCPPGMALVSVSAKARKIVERESGMPRFYWDFRKALASAEKSETAFTAPVGLMAGMHASLQMIHEEGLPAVLRRHKCLSSALRAGCAALGLKAFGDEAVHSPTVVALEVPESLNGGDIVKQLYERNKTVIAGARNKYQGRMIRIGTMGHVHKADILTDLEHLEDTLTYLGWRVERGAGVSAAMSVLGDMHFEC